MKTRAGYVSDSYAHGSIFAETFAAGKKTKKKAHANLANFPT